MIDSLKIVTFLKKGVFLNKSLLTSLVIFSIIFILCGREIDFMELHKSSLVADLHCDTALRMLQGIQISVRDTSGHVDIPRLREGGVDLQVFACFISTNHPKDDCADYVHRMLDTLEAQFERNKANIAICTKAKEAEEIINSGRIAGFLAIENGVAIENNLEELKNFYKRGVRYLTLTHILSNDWCISSGDENPESFGLTDFGREVVKKMNELGMIIDVSHASESAFWEVLKVTTDPIIASHSCVYALNPHDRNLKDEQLKALAKNGGMVGINFFSAYLSKEFNGKLKNAWEKSKKEKEALLDKYKDDQKKRREVYHQIWEEIKEELKGVKVDVSLVVDHIDYVVNLVGVDYVGLGSDFDGVTFLSSGLEDCSKLPEITKELVRRGYSEDDIKKILGGNFMRVFREVCDK